MALLKIEDAVLPNKDGKLLVQEIELVGKTIEKGTKVKVFPLLDEEFGELVELLDGKKADQAKLNKIIIKKVLEPEITEKSVTFLKPVVKAAIFKSILTATGIDEKLITEKTFGSKDDSKKA